MIKGLLAALIVLTSGFLVQGSNHDCPAYPASKWSFNPETLAEKAEFQNQMMVQLAASVPGRDVFGATVRQNFVDEHIFSRLESEGIQPANLAGDEEFIRRIYLDLTGRLPDYDKVISFLDDQSTNKRDRLIDELLNSEAFIDRWTFWLNEVIRNTSSYANVTIQGRNALHFYIRDAIERNVPYNVLVSDLIKGSGSARSNGPATFVLRSYSAADPLHDSWDDFTANTMSAFLGITSLCVSCHDGARHLEAINTYLAERKRREFWQQAAFVSQMTITRIPLDGSNRIVDYEIEDRPGGAYHTRVTGGQRPLRSGGPYSPVYMLSGDAPRTSGYRAELARILTSDIQFARATANRVWAHLMGVGIVDPVDGFDPLRYQVQASHPELLDALARDFINSGYNLRQLIRRIVTSSAYQLSVRYPGTWRESYRRLFARKITRPLDAEEIHDSIVKATGMTTMYFIDGFDRPVTWAMQLPDTNEPRRGDALAFMRVFGRGNRVDQLRSTDSSILGSLSMMNSTFITTRVTSANSTNVARLLQMQMSDEELVNRMFLQTLSRRPTTEERQAALANRPRNRTEWAEDVQWVLLNKLDFLFSY